MICEICGRESDDDSLFERHHLIPIKTRRTKEEKDDVIIVDRTCGDQIHLMFDNTKLRMELNSLEMLRKEMAPFIMWVRGKPINQHLSMKRKKRKI